MDEIGDLASLFGPRGALAQCVQGFAPRAEQLAMAEAVGAALRTGQDLVVEAGTGTGKTLAYLVPALLCGRKLVVATGTRTLQDQLYHRDLPTLARALGRPVDVQLLKGRANYLCLHRLERLESEPGRLARETGFGALRTWAGRTRAGDIAECEGVPEDSPLWPRVTSTAENCLGTRCPRFDDCHVVAARKRARDADLVVANQHLLMADLTMKEEGFGELLPGADAVIVDEAHHFPTVAQSFFNVSVGSGQIAELLADVQRDSREAGVFGADLESAIQRTHQALDDTQRALPATDGTHGWGDAGAAFQHGLDELGEALADLAEALEPVRAADASLQREHERALAQRADLQAIVYGADDEGLRWIRRTPRRFTANRTPFDAADELRAMLDARACTWIFTSATLAVGDDFSHYRSRLGLDDVVTRRIPSPFAYAEITRLYVPPDLPPPSRSDYTDACVRAVLPVLEASRGRAFLLFTSHRALRSAAELLVARADFDYPLLVQGTAPRSRLLERFARERHAVLLGTATFWEGVDIRGHGLVLVAIDKLPFASPSDPMLAARLEAIRNHNGNPFRDYQLPQAVLALKQGVGRLIRDYDDYGIVMICDPRLLQKSYGRVFMESLPPMPLTRDLDEVRRFFAERDAGQK